MRILFVNPYYPISETPSPPLGLAYLAAALEGAGVEVKVLDLVVFPYSKKVMESLLKDFSPQMVGFTSVTMSFDNAIDVLKDVKSLDPGILTVMGGPHVSFCAPDTMASFPEIDFIVPGEGEETIVELAKEWNNGGDWGHVKGIIYRNGSGICSTGIRKSLIEMDSLPVPSRHLLPLGRYRALGMPISMTTSRGCPFKCIFCVGRKMGGVKVRYGNPRRVVDEMESLSELNFHQINLADDLFTANERHCLAVCNEIIERELNIKWTSFARVDTVSMEVLRRMKEAGCDTVSFGVETSNPGILKTIKKGITTEQVLAAVNMCTNAGITPHASFILGLPGETPETLKETIDFGKRLKDMGVAHGFHLLAPFPGTEIREKNDKYGIKILTDDWRQYHANRAIVETSSVNREMLDEIVIEWENQFDEWLGEIKRLREKGEAAEDEAWQLTRLEHTVLIYDLMMGKVLEEKGSWPDKGEPVSAGDTIKTLVNRIAGSIDHEQEQVFNTLTFAVEQGNLRCIKENGQVRWEWVDFL